MHLFLVLFLFNFMKLPQCLVSKLLKKCIGVCLVRIVYSPMISISKLTNFK